MNRANIESVLIGRCGQLLAAVGLDSATANGTNSDLNDPIWFALNRCGYGVTDISAVSDFDVSQVDDEDLAALLDIAELRVIETARNSATSLVDITIGPRRESLSQLSGQLEKTIASKRAQILLEHGSMFGRGLQAGTFAVGSQEDGEGVY